MAVITLGRRRVVSTSKTALKRRTAIAHIFVEQLTTPTWAGQQFVPLQYVPLQAPPDPTLGYYSLVACGKRIWATHNPTLMIKARKNDPDLLQDRTPCQKCIAVRGKGEMTFTIEPPTIWELQLKTHVTE